MAENTIEIPDFVTVLEPDRPLSELTRIASDLLDGEASGLAAPRFLEVCGASQQIELGFGGKPDTFHQMAAWADHFGATLTAAPHADSDGTPYVRCGIAFFYKGVHVTVYADVQAATATT